MMSCLDYLCSEPNVTDVLNRHTSLSVTMNQLIFIHKSIRCYVMHVQKSFRNLIESILNLIKV